MGTWSTGIGKFKKPDPDHGWLWKKLVYWYRRYIASPNIYPTCKNPKCTCSKNNKDNFPPVKGI
jgi:hypothetical protein